MKKLELLIRIEELENLVLELKHQLTSHCTSTNDVVKLLEENYERVSTLQNEVDAMRDSGIKQAKLIRQLDSEIQLLKATRPVYIPVPNNPCGTDHNPPRWIEVPYTVPQSPTFVPYPSYPFVTWCQAELAADSNTAASQRPTAKWRQALGAPTGSSTAFLPGCPG
jgi:hypothetical protein